MKTGRLFADGRLVAPHARRAVGPLERARGLLARPAPKPGEALLLDPCAGIHTWAMAYPIDAAFLDRRGRVLRIAANLPPWRFAACKGGHAVVEWAAGETQRLSIVTGTTLEWRDGREENE
jgi:uncharacterized membrane protein (UPF0127 family)